MVNLSGKTALVTGGSGGIGQGIVRKLVCEGAFVVFGYKEGREQAERISRAVEEIGGNALAVQADLTLPGGAVKLFDEAEQAVSGVDVLVNNAAVMKRATFARSTDAELDEMVTLNIKGTFFALREAALRLRDGGRIINISSTATVLAHPSQAVYSMTKAAVDQMTRVAAKELNRRGITVNTVSPGAVETEEMRVRVRSEVRDQWARSSAFGRLGRPEDIADVIAFLAGPESRWITGQNLHAAGGAV